MPKKSALFIGRFQPLHKGHIHAIKSAMKKYDVTVVVGSINKKGQKNPYPYALRRKMLESEFPGLKITGMHDTTDAKWVRKIKRMKFDVVISGNSHVWKLLWDCRLESPDFLKIKYYNGTKIRRLMGRKKSVSKRVTAKTGKIIEK